MIASGSLEVWHAVRKRGHRREAHRPGDVRRRLPRHALPPRHAVALERARVPPEGGSDLERLRRLDHLRSPGRSLAPPAMGQRPRDELPGRDRQAAAGVLRPPHRRTGDRGRDDPAVEGHQRHHRNPVPAASVRRRDPAAASGSAALHRELHQLHDRRRFSVLEALRRRLSHRPDPGADTERRAGGDRLQRLSTVPVSRRAGHRSEPVQTGLRRRSLRQRRVPHAAVSHRRGVYDNLGLETLDKRCKTLLVSDAGAPFVVDPDPSKTWVKQTLRAFDIATNQARALRTRALIDDFRSGAHRGSYWGITTLVADYQVADALPVSPEATRYLSSMRTRLNPFTDAEQCRLINGGYALCDAAMRKYVIPGAGPAPRWPYPQFSLDRPIAPAETVAAAAGGYESP